MERASWFQFGLVGAEASGGGLMKRVLLALLFHEGSHGISMDLAGAAAS